MRDIKRLIGYLYVINDSQETVYNIYYCVEIIIKFFALLYFIFD